jgi:hypothetical protein
VSRGVPDLAFVAGIIPIESSHSLDRGHDGKRRRVCHWPHKAETCERLLGQFLQDTLNLRDCIREQCLIDRNTVAAIAEETSIIALILQRKAYQLAIGD